MTKYTILGPIYPPEKCYLFEVLLWRAFGRFPEVHYSNNGKDWRFESDVRDGYEAPIPDESIDIALLYDTLHALSEPDKVLAELHRVLKSNGILSFNDHHMRESEIMSKITDKGLFRLSRKGKRAYNFSKV